jgi:Uma2 family endonuclease
MSLEEFLEWPGDGRAKRYELMDGEVRPMPVTSVAHGVIHVNVGCAIVEGIAKSGVPLRGLMLAGIVPGTRPDINFRVADLAVTSAPDVAGQIVVPGVVLAAEILSPGNERDTREAVRTYTTVASMQEILVVNSTRIAAEILRRQADEH